MNIYKIKKLKRHFNQMQCALSYLDLDMNKSTVKKLRENQGHLTTTRYLGEKKKVLPLDFRQNNGIVGSIGSSLSLSDTQ